MESHTSLLCHLLYNNPEQMCTRRFPNPRDRVLGESPNTLTSPHRRRPSHRLPCPRRQLQTTRVSGETPHHSARSPRPADPRPVCNSPEPGAELRTAGPHSLPRPTLLWERAALKAHRHPENQGQRRVAEGPCSAAVTMGGQGQGHRILPKTQGERLCPSGRGSGPWLHKPEGSGGSFLNTPCQPRPLQL